MAGPIVISSNFARGEIAPELALRDDVEHYHAGAKELTNVLGVPQGGLQRRPGLRYHATLPGPSRLIPWEFNVDQVYVIALSDLTLGVYENGELVFQTATPYTQAELFDLFYPVRFSQQADTMIFVHGSHPPLKLLRDTSAPVEPDDSGWSPQWQLYRLIDFGDIAAEDQVDAEIPLQVSTSGVTQALKNLPRFSFDDADTPATTNEVQYLAFTGTWTDNDEYALRLKNQKYGVIHYSSDPDVQLRRLEKALEFLIYECFAGAADFWEMLDGNVPAKYQGTIEITNEDTGSPKDPNGPYRIEFIDIAGNQNWPAIYPDLGDDPDIVGDGLIEITHEEGDAIEGGSGSEQVWSKTRGFPRSVTFHESRLCFGGSPSLPTTVWLSKTEDPFNFSTGSALDDDAIAATMGADRMDAVVDVVSLRNFVVLTTGGEFYSAEMPTTPRNVSFRRDSARGSAAVRPILLDGSVVYLQRDRKAIRQMVWSDTENSYIAPDLTILSRHMLDFPIDSASQQGTLGDYLYFVNSNGSMIVLNFNRDQGINAWTRFETGAKFVSVAVVHDYQQSQNVWVSTQRSIAGAVVNYLERLDPALTLDCATEAVTENGLQWSGLDHLEGQDVTCFIDGGDNVLTATVEDGQIELSDVATTLVAGLNTALPVIETLPVAIGGQSGRMILGRCRLPRVRVDVMGTRDIYVGASDRDPVCLNPSAGFEESGPVSYTGVLETRVLGWAIRPTITITQQAPMPFFLRGIEYEVEVH